MRLMPSRRRVGRSGKRQNCRSARRVHRATDGGFQKRRPNNVGARKATTPVDDLHSKGINDQEIEAAAAYFSALQPRAAIRVVEAESVPKTKVTGWHLAVAADDETEPLGQRIVEVPENLEYFALRDGRARFIAYVPPGSVQRGQALVASGNSKTVACGICHGPDLKGLGPIPGLAGRSPSYVVRQLYDFKTGARAGAWSALMAPVVEELSVDDMISLAAYAASLSP